MVDCKVMMKAPIKKVKDLFQEYDEDMEFSKRGSWTLVEVFSGTILFGWEVSDWVEQAENHELIYAYYDEDLNAEFIHVKDGRCLRAYQIYDGEVEIDEGDDPETSISKWSDVANYMDSHMS